MIEINVILDNVLGIEVARGFEKLSTLSQISQADVYDVETNPQGTQSDLSKKHAREAYEYILSENMSFWPELFLNARDKTVVKFVSIKDNYGKLIIDEKKIVRQKKVSISRVDGNHRLHFAGGQDPKYPPIDKKVSFCMALDLDLNEEIKLFKDINDNQRRMNTSHLDNISLRLSDKGSLRLNRDLYIADRLTKDSNSPFYGIVYLGGKKDAKHFLGLRNIKSGLNYMFSTPSRLTAIEDLDVQTQLVKNYFIALQQLTPEAWTKPRDYILLRGAGFWAACFLGAEVIDRALGNGEFS